MGEKEKSVKLVLNQQQLELIDATIARVGVADREGCTSRCGNFSPAMALLPRRKAKEGNGDRTCMQAEFARAS
ncbi:MAG: hypothetical protein E6G96_15920 [Alphaproteobacteria bacterium]|nr:MAG: hypothetical protein E6G96_15920 [Alphaproteobacteria bacterium]